ncbi:MAG TPA: LytR C-terminal domain-containing protein [Mycobacteriales bacterium]|nr:LytR C-terminal domain-containing protein [Mycobacteriales bacterium]
MAALIVGLVLVRGQPAGGIDSAVVGSPPMTTLGPPPTAPPTAPPTPTPTPTPTARTGAAPAVRTEPTAVRPALTVLNNSRITGLARHSAAEFAAAGWPIQRIGNFTGRIPQTTVYYAPGEEAAAAALQAAFPRITRRLPRFAGLTGALTVILTRYYAGA